LNSFIIEIDLKMEEAYYSRGVEKDPLISACMYNNNGPFSVDW